MTQRLPVPAAPVVWSCAVIVMTWPIICFLICLPSFLDWRECAFCFEILYSDVQDNEPRPAKEGTKGIKIIKALGKLEWFTLAGVM